MNTAKMSHKGQIVIPKPLREKFGLKPGCSFRITELDGHIVIIPLFNDPIKDTQGILKKKYPEKLISADEMLNEYHEEEKELESRKEELF